MNDTNNQTNTLLVEKLTSIVGADNIITDNDEIEPLLNATYPAFTHYSAMIYPQNVEQIQKIIRYCDQENIKIYTVSRGMNWSYGSMCSPKEASVLMCLNKMNKILFYNPDLGCITVEPGVSQYAVAHYLREKKSNFYLEPTGFSGLSSLLGNILEKGFPLGRTGNRFDTLIGIEAVLASGDIVRTNIDAKGTLLNYSRYTPGPYIPGLFVQSNYAVITKVSVNLTPRPKYLGYYSVQINDDRKLAELFDAFRKLKLDGIVEGSYGIWNGVKYNSVNRPPNMHSEGLDIWRSWGYLYAPTKQYLEALINEFKAVMEPVVDELFCEEATKNENYVPSSPEEANKIPKLEAGSTLIVDYDMPSDRNVFQLYWEKAECPEIFDFNPYRDRIGLRQLYFTVNNNGETITRSLRGLKKIFDQYHVGFNTAVLVNSTRFVFYQIFLIYDRTKDGRDAEVLNCYEDSVKYLLEQGHSPYRVGIESMNFENLDNNHRKIMKQIKSLLDPNMILSPGRYTDQS